MFEDSGRGRLEQFHLRFGIQREGGGAASHILRLRRHAIRRLRRLISISHQTRPFCRFCLISVFYLCGVYICMKPEATPPSVIKLLLRHKMTRAHTLVTLISFILCVVFRRSHFVIEAYFVLYFIRQLEINSGCALLSRSHSRRKINLIIVFSETHT